MKNIKVIKSEKDYRDALNRLNKIIDTKPGSPEADELLILSLLIEYYEDEHYPIGYPDPIEAIKIRLEDLGLRQKDLVGIAGSTKGRVSEVLNKKRPLTLPVIRKIEKFLRIPGEILIQEYKLNSTETPPPLTKKAGRQKLRRKRKIKTPKANRTGIVGEPKSKKYGEN